jgi:BirA family biotin operon repressor/biotin-[acetyl-CoA-carboxylase] ligase
LGSLGPFSLEGLETDFVGQNPVYRPAIGSTNDEARRLARAGAPEGTLVVTDYQTLGRGRLDRRWEAPAGSSLLISLVFRPALAAHQVQRLTMISGLAAVDAIEAETGLQVGLKWPNDLVIGGAKLGGILTEIELEGSRVDYAVVGVGLNVNLDPGQLPQDLLVAATSLSHELGRKVARLPLLYALLRAMEVRYKALQAGQLPQAEWAARLVSLGRPVAVSVMNSRLEGVAEGVDDDGALLLRLSDGRLETILVGDVTVHRSEVLRHTNHCTAITD